MQRYANLNHSQNPSPDHIAEPPSKTSRKKAMHALQELGEALVELPPEKLAELDLPERLCDAIREARRITSHEARRRQLQYVGRLMREVDPAPLRAQMEAWAQAPRREKALMHHLENWRDRLLDEPQALDELCAAHPGIERSHWRNLIRRAGEERAAAQPPKHYRLLFQELKSLLDPPPPT